MLTSTRAALGAALAVTVAASAPAQTFILDPQSTAPAVISFPRLPRTPDPVPGTITFQGHQHPATGARHDGDLWIWVPFGWFWLRGDHTYQAYDPEGHLVFSGVWE